MSLSFESFKFGDIRNKNSCNYKYTVVLDPSYYMSKIWKLLYLLMHNYNSKDYFDQICLHIVTILVMCKKNLFKKKLLLGFITVL